ncbi:MAG: T9SS type A sorting domain-containing protein [Cytophagaceae bacterium]|nr:T9SS type A sorting domain-containing protein [Cytophagaceae bacterium]
MKYFTSPLCGMLLFLFSLTTQATTRTVTSAADNGAGSFRNALSASANGDVIQFGIAGSGVHLITLTSVIGVTQSNLTIDATTQTGYTCGNPTIIIDLGGAWPCTFNVQGTGNTIKGISFRNVLFTFNGGGSHTLQGCWFNLDNTGAAVSGNNMGSSLMTFTNSTGNTIGGITCGTRNVFSMGGASYTYLGAIRLNTGCNNNSFIGNYFGTDKTGMSTMLNQNSDHIFWIDNSTGITFDQNVICGARPAGAIGGFGIYTDGASANGLTITNNKIGVRSDGTDGGTTWGNAYGGVAVESTTCNNFTFNGNTVCQNGLVAGADIQKCGLYVLSSCATVNIKNNFVGVTPTFQIAGNYFTGIFINGTCSGVTIDNNVIGGNGYTLGTGDESHGLSLEQACTNVSITNNYIGTNSAGADLGNYCSGITISGGSNYTLTNNVVGFNKGKRVGIPNACMVFTNTTDVVIQGNTLGGFTSAGPAGQKNQGMNIDGGAGIFISGASSQHIRIGGMNTGQQNAISYNRSSAIEVQNGDYVEMRWNIMYCNGLKGIDLNYGTTLSANNNFGRNNVSITTPGSATFSSLSGTRPANSIMDIYGTGSCASSTNCISQSEYRYTGTYTPSASNVAGTSWSFNYGATMFNDISGLATGGGTDCSSGYCRTSEFSPCIDNVLPVTLVSFTATWNGQYSELKWRTAQEINASLFLVERSVDGEHFITIGTIPTEGSEHAGHAYFFEDENVPQGTSYYRLREEDADGTFAYSEIKAVHRDTKAALFISPNPNNGTFTILLTGQKSAVNVQVHNALGILLYESNHAAAQTINLPISLSGQHPGMYIVSVTDEHATLSSKIVVE